MKIVDHFEIPYYQYLNEQSELSDDAPPLAKKIESLCHLYRLMSLVRVFDAKAIALQRTGQLGTYPSTCGQEAVFVGIGHALQQKDIYVPYYRDLGAVIQRGVTLTQILLYWGGDERGNGHIPESRDFPYSVPIGTQALHAAGAAFSLKFHHEKQAVLTVCGDGATSEGDFYEAMNVAGIWKLPIVFVVCNNQWAISVPRECQTASHTIAQKAIAAGFSGEQIDGNDVIAVETRTALALKEAREKGEPRLLEMMCYRHCDHTTADDASRYESKEIRPREWKKEPIIRLRHYLEKIGAWDEAKEAALQVECTERVNQAVKEYSETIPQPSTGMFDYLYAELPDAYREQYDLLVDKEGENG